MLNTHKGLTIDARRFQFRPAWATDTRQPGMIGSIKSLFRVAQSAIEKYAVYDVDVLVTGADPYLLLLSSYIHARQHRSVLVAPIADIALPGALHSPNVHRLIHLPQCAQEAMATLMPGLVDPKWSHEMVLTGLCDVIRTLRDDTGKPYVYLYKDQRLSPDNGKSRGWRDRHIFWPVPRVTPVSSEMREINQYHQFLAKNLPAARFVRKGMTVSLVCASRVTLTSPIYDYGDDLRCPMDRVGAASDIINDPQQYHDRMRVRDFTNTFIML